MGDAVTGPVEWLERRLTRVEGYAQETAQRFPGACWPGDAVQVLAFGAAEFVEEVAAPENMLRLAAGARQILAEHQEHEGRPWCCRVCISDREDLYPEQWESDRWPCRTVRLLAEAWGWEETA